MKDNISLSPSYLIVLHVKSHVRTTRSCYQYSDYLGHVALHTINSFSALLNTIVDLV